MSEILSELNLSYQVFHSMAQPQLRELVQFYQHPSYLWTQQDKSQSAGGHMKRCGVHVCKLKLITVYLKLYISNMSFNEGFFKKESSVISYFLSLLESCLNIWEPYHHSI